MKDEYRKMVEEAVRDAQSLAQNDVETLCMSDVQMNGISWLWPKRFARGKLSVIGGNPGLGKSQLILGMAAIISRGSLWPNNEGQAATGNVVILSAEDDAGDTIKPRLAAAGADMSRCFVLNAIRVPKQDGKLGVRSFDFSTDVDRLAGEIARIGNVQCVIVDPFSAYLGKTDSNNNSEVRGLLAPLAAMAAQYQVAVILLTHLNKSNQQDIIGRIIGSIGLVAAARAGYVVMKDEEDDGKRYLLPIKNNIGNDHDGFVFRIHGVTLPEGIETSKICWEPGVVKAHTILNPPKKTSAATTGAMQCLEGLLANGPLSANEVFDAAGGHGYNKSAMQRAKQRLGIKTRKTGMDGGWVWELPSGDPHKMTQEEG